VSSGSRPEPQSIWSRPEPAARKPAHTRDGIAAAAIRIADLEGFDALTMRRVAAELGAGTMTLYHYVRTKDELLALVDNALTGELVIPAGELPEGWRAGTREIAIRTREVFVRHPWIAEMPRNIDDGPNRTLHIEQSLAVMARTGLPYPDCLELILLVDDYVFGYIERFNPIREFLGGDREALANRHSEELGARLARLDEDTFPTLRAFLAGADPQEAVTRFIDLALDPTRFERGLEVLLDGIEQRLAKRRVNRQ
jgi:AcrR family transcriptional regulator